MSLVLLTRFSINLFLFQDIRVKFLVQINTAVNTCGSPAAVIYVNNYSNYSVFITSGWFHKQRVEIGITSLFVVSSVDCRGVRVNLNAGVPVHTRNSP